MGKLQINGAASLTGLLSAHGGISLNESTAQETPAYLLGIKAFADGGNVIWESIGDISVGHATSSSACTGNAATATKLKTARTLTIGASGKTFNGSANVSWTPFEMRLTRAQYSVGTNMNQIADHGCELGMANLSGTDTNINPGGKTSWHHYINMTWTDCVDNNGETSNEWCTQIATKAGTTDLWVRSRSGGSITDGTAWAANWTRILTGSNYTSVLDGRYVQVDKYVQQSRSTSANWRPLLSHYTATSRGTDPSAATNICYYNEKASIKPSTGQIYAAGGLILGNTIKWTSALTKVTSPTVVAAYIGNDSANGLGYCDTSSITAGYSTLWALTGTANTYTGHSDWDGAVGNSSKYTVYDQEWGCSSIGSDTGDLRVFVRPGVYTSGGTEVCFAIDGDFYVMGHKVQVTAGYGSSLPSSGLVGEVFYKI